MYLYQAYAIWAAVWASTQINFQFSPATQTKTGTFVTSVNSISAILTSPSTDDFYVQIFDPYYPTIVTNSTTYLRYNSTAVTLTADANAGFPVYVSKSQDSTWTGDIWTVVTPYNYKVLRHVGNSFDWFYNMQNLSTVNVSSYYPAQYAHLKPSNTITVTEEVKTLTWVD